MADLPIEAVLPDLIRALAAGSNAVLQAPPGAGKTTRVPLALLEQPWLGQRKIVMLEPRRLAARAAARRMAATLGEEVGQTVGYRVRMDQRVGPKTRIEVVTDGVFTRLIQDDPGLEGVGAVLFDEFHERSLEVDLGLALCLESQAAIRPELRLVAMSATLAAAPVARLLGEAPIIASEGRAFPVATRYVDRAAAGRIEDDVAATVRRALAEEPGDLLVFLPGLREIRRVESLLEASGLGPGIVIAPLHGDLPLDGQDRAIRPSQTGLRKVVLATSIAETSLTIEGIRVVIDSGLMRVPRFDPRSAMTRLDTIRVSQAAAGQRRGRAGRLGPGVCYRLWAEATHRTLAPFTQPEILEADLAPLALELAQWGAGDPARLAWLDPPPRAAYEQARDLLRRLGALDAADRLTAHGRAIAGLGLHPRLAHMIVRGQALGLGGLACDLAALLSERDIVKADMGARDTDLRLRVELLAEGRHPALPPGLHLDRTARDQVLRAARQWRRRIGAGDAAGDAKSTGAVVELAYPDRVAQRRPGGDGRYRLASGQGAFFPSGPSQALDPLAAEDWLAVADLDGAKREARIFLAAPLLLAEIEEGFADQIVSVESCAWNARVEAVEARRQRRLGALLLKDEPWADAPDDVKAAALLDGIRALGLNALPWTPELRNWQARVLFLRTHGREAGGDEAGGDEAGGDEGWPDVADPALMAALESWLLPHLAGITRRAHFKRIDLAAALHGMLDWRRRQDLDREAPTHLAVPSGSRIPLDYTGGAVPVLAVRLQEMFGLTATPRIAGGRVPLVVHLLSPARRPLAVTQDLASFWANAYQQVKRDMRGQYPKHHWPDDPLSAPPTNRAKRRVP
jgi:ATP-dependent helicase HrpB